jgi:hypothetical protein
MRRSIHKLATWVFLVAYMLSGVLAAQLVVCLEPDGKIALEPAEPNGCMPCGGSEDSSQDLGGMKDQCCPCIDIPLPWQGEDPHAKSKTSGPLAAVVPACLVAAVLGVEPGEHRLLVRAPPRSAQSLALIRTVVLRV